jgi:hypothetical protein
VGPALTGSTKADSSSSSESIRGGAPLPAMGRYAASHHKGQGAHLLCRRRLRVPLGGELWLPRQLSSHPRQVRLAGTLAPVSRDTVARAGDPLRVAVGEVANAVRRLARTMGDHVARMQLTVTERRVDARPGQEETRAKRRRGGGGIEHRAGGLGQLLH